MALWPLLLGLGLRLRLRLRVGLLLLLLCSEVPWVTCSHKEDKVKDGVRICLYGRYVNGLCEKYPKGTYMDQPNKETEKPCDLKCGINELCSKGQCQCKPGFCKNSFCPEACDVCTSCRNHRSPGSGMMVSDSPNRGTRKPPPANLTGQQVEATTTLTVPPAQATGSAGNHLPEWPKYVGVALAWLVFYLCDQLRIWWFQCISYFRDQKRSQGQVHDVGGPDPRNNLEMQTGPKVAVNGQCNSEETHSLLPGRNFTPDSAISVVPEVMPQSGSPETPPTAQVTLEQELECTSVVSNP